MKPYTVDQVAKMLHIGRDKVYYLLRTRQLRSIKIGKSRRITSEQLPRNRRGAVAIAATAPSCGL